MKDKIAFSLSFIALILSILLIAYNHEGINNSETITKEVDCYDRFGNKIIGTVCERESFKYQTEGAYVAIGFILGSISLIFLIMSIINIMEEKEE